MAYEKYKMKSEVPQRRDRPSGNQGRSTSGQGQRRPRPSQNSGTIRNNMDRYQTDRVSQAKDRQAAFIAKNVSDREIAMLKAAKREKKKKLIVRLSLFVLVLIICGLCFLFAYRIFYDVPVNEEDTRQVEITIPNESITDDEVAKLLMDAGCISDARIYKIRTKIYEAKYVPGTYKVSPSYSTEKIINILSGYDYSTEGVMEE